MQTKKTLALLIVLAFLAAGMVSATGVQEAVSEAPISFNPTGFPIVDEPIEYSAWTIDYWGVPPRHEAPIIQAYAEKTNVFVVFESIPGAANTERLNLAAASDDWPDFFLSFFGMDTGRFVDEGALIAVDELIDRYAPNITGALEEHPEARDFFTAYDGRMYTVPHINYIGASSIGAVTGINRPWLDRLGLDVPTTTDELYTVLRAFKEDSPDRIPMTALWADLNRGLGMVFSAFGVLPAGRGGGTLFVLRDGEFVENLLDPGYREAIRYLSDLYREGLLDPEVFTMDHTVYDAKIGENPDGFGVVFNWTPAHFIERDVDRARDLFYLIEPLAGPRGHRMTVSQPAGLQSTNFITKAARNPEVVIRYMDGIADPVEGMQWDRGPISTNIELREDGRYHLLPADTPGFIPRQLNAVIWATHGLTQSWVQENFRSDAVANYKSELDARYVPHARLSTPIIRLSPEERAISDVYLPDIRTYIVQKEAEWVMNGTIDAEWDAFVRQLHNMNYNELVDIYREAYLRTR